MSCRNRQTHSADRHTDVCARLAVVVMLSGPPVLQFTVRVTFGGHHCTLTDDRCVPPLVGLKRDIRSHWRWSGAYLAATQPGLQLYNGLEAFATLPSGSLSAKVACRSGPILSDFFDVAKSAIYSACADRTIHSNADRPILWRPSELSSLYECRVNLLRSGNYLSLRNGPSQHRDPL
jgi:hypothetical protein